MPLTEEQPIQKMSTVMDELTTVYVYELALKLRNQFDSLIQLHGADSYEGVVPIVVRTLEQLECLTKQYDMSRAEVEELKYTIERLQVEKRAKAVEKEKYQKELETIEESWHGNAKLQNDLIIRLQTENHRLNDVIKNKMDDVVDTDRMTIREASLEDEICKLKAMIQRQRDEIRAMERDLCLKTETIDELESNLDRARKQTAELKRKTSFNQAQVQSLLEDKSNLEVQLHDREVQLNRIKDDRLRRSTSSGNGAPGDDQTPNSLTPLTDDEFARLVARLSVENKMVIDLNDSDQPRFTLADVSDVMAERNRLKEQVICLEEELNQYKPDFAKLEEGAIMFNEEELDPPVHGPINKEPEEKLYPDRFPLKGSSIRKLFKHFICKIESHMTRLADEDDDEEESNIKS